MRPTGTAALKCGVLPKGVPIDASLEMSCCKTHHVLPKRFLEDGLTEKTGSPKMIPVGGTQCDYSLHWSWMLQTTLPQVL